MSQPVLDEPSPPGRARRWLRWATDFRVVIPAIITLGLLAYVSTLAVAPASGGQIWRIMKDTWWIVLLLTLPYIGARAFLWWELLDQLSITVPWRPLLLALAGGEIGKTVPGGIYVENYLLARLGHFHEVSVVRSTVATTATLALESAIALPVALAVGIPHAPWLFWTLVGIVGGWLAAMAVVWFVVRYWALHLLDRMPRWLRHAGLIAEELIEGAADLLTWRTLRSVVPAAVYMLVYVADLYLIARAVGVHRVSFFDVMGIYAIVVLIVILVPVPTKLGTTEYTGLTAFVAYSIPRATAAIIMLGLRIMTTGMTILVAAILIFLLRGEFSRRRQAQPQAVEAAASGAAGSTDDGS